MIRQAARLYSLSQVVEAFDKIVRECFERRFGGQVGRVRRVESDFAMKELVRLKIIGDVIDLIESYSGAFQAKI